MFHHQMMELNVYVPLVFTIISIHINTPEQ